MAEDIEIFDFDDASEADAVEMLDFDDASEADDVEMLDFDDASEVDDVEMLDFDDASEVDDIEVLDFDDSGEADDIETLDYDDKSELENTEPILENYVDEGDFNEILTENEFNNDIASNIYYTDDSQDDLSANSIENFNWDDYQDNGYYDEYISIMNDDTLTDEQKQYLINPMIEELQSMEEDVGSAKVLKRDDNELLDVGNDGVNSILESLENEYRVQGMTDEEIQSQLQNDRINLQQEFLNDAFPNQEVSPEVFNNLNNDSVSDVDHVSDVSDWVGEINPNFDEFDTESPYSNNCGSCAYAIYQRFEGMDPEACASENNIGYNDEMEALTGMEQVSMSPSEIENRLLEEGEGAHAIIGVDRADGPGHWFNAACIDGKVVAIDGQTGEILDWPPDYGDVVNWEMSVKKGA